VVGEVPARDEEQKEVHDEGLGAWYEVLQSISTVDLMILIVKIKRED
jgi:hypothetical protein